jgi:hypothetical protein
VEWSGLCFSFSRYIPNFDASSQGAEAQLIHAMKVQSPNLHEQFWNSKALTIMASKIGEVLEIESADSYIKRPAGPMITIKLKDISKLLGYIRIPSMAEGAETDDLDVTVGETILEVHHRSWARELACPCMCAVVLDDPGVRSNWPERCAVRLSFRSCSLEESSHCPVEQLTSVSVGEALLVVRHRS